MVCFSFFAQITIKIEEFTVDIVKNAFKMQIFVGGRFNIGNI